METLPDHSVISGIMDVIGSFKASVRSFNVNEREKNHERQFDVSARILVTSNLELDKVISQISVLPKVKSVRRG